MPGKKFDYLIIGQGLAGSLMAFSLIEQGQSVLVIDNDHQRSSSRVAAGIINPVTGHRLNITNGFKTYYPIAQQTYADLDHCFKSSKLAIKGRLLTEIKQSRLIKNQGQADYFSKRLSQPDYDDILTETDNHYFSNAPYGCADVQHTAVVDTKTLLKASKAWLHQRNALLHEKFVYEKIEFYEQHVSYRDFSARGIIFCEGYQAINNPLLSHLPFKLARGDILTVATTPHSPAMLSWGQWLVPAVEDTAKLGASFDWSSLDCTPKSEDATKLLESLASNTKISAEVIKHEVGIRPTTRQRRPFVGPLSAHDNAYCLNGLGSKGCLIAPYYANKLTDYLLRGAPLEKDLTQWL